MHSAGNIETNESSRLPGAPELSALRVVPGAQDDDTPLIYDLRADLRGGELPGRTYEADVAAFAARLTAEAEARAAQFLNAYAEYVRTALGESARSRGEYVAELLTLGMAFRHYEPAAGRTPTAMLWVARLLLDLRKTRLKTPADRVRAGLFRHYLPDWAADAPIKPEARKLPRLVAWLRASGEFRQEAARLSNWNAFLGTLAPGAVRDCVSAAVELFAWFEREADAALGRYTEGVPRFLNGEFARREVREDQLFCGRTAVEYHLGMVASELMNAGLRAQFEKTKRRAVLVPACMRGAHAATCRARLDGVDITCAGCDAACTVNRITRSLQKDGVPVYIVPHASSFSRWLERWQREHDVGVVAVACLMNILAGGYEMRARGIASQCVVLDYPGCEKHWREHGIATSVNEQRLVQIAMAASR